MSTTSRAGAVLVVASLAGAAAAQDAASKKDEKDKPELRAEVERLEAFPMPGEIVVSARRGVPLTYAGGRDVIERDVLERYPDGDVATVLRRVPGVVILPENGNDGRANIGLRGADPRRSGLTTILVDGVPISEAPYGNTDVDGLPIAFERIGRIDVIRGGASIRWGPNSAGGVINFVTEPIPSRATSRFAARYGGDGAWSASTSQGGTWDRFGTLVTLVDKGGDGFRENSRYEDRDASAKFRYVLDDRDTLTWAVSRFQELDAEQPGGLTQAAYDADPSQSLRHGADFRFSSNVYQAEFVHDVGPGSAFQLIAWRHEGFRGLFDFRPILRPFTVHREQNSDFSSGALEARFSWTADFLGAKHSFFHSARYLTEKNRELYQRIPIAGGPAARPYELDAVFEGNSFSLFNEDVISLTDSLDLALGARTEDLDMGSRSRDATQPKVKKSQSYDEFLPEASLTWKAAKDVALYGSFQRNFMAPQYETGFDPSSSFFRPIKPEHSQTYEVGARVRAVPGLEFAAAGFDTEFKDKIDFVNLPSGTKIAVNSGAARSRGVELAAAYDFGKASPDLAGFSVYATLTKQRSTIESGANDGNDAPHSPRTLASWGALYEHASGLWARVGGSRTASQFKDPENTPTGDAGGVTGPEPAYALWDAAVGWRERKDGEGFAVEVGVTNLFDRAYYRRFVSGIYPGAPRQVFVGASYALGW